MVADFVVVALGVAVPVVASATVSRVVVPVVGSATVLRVVVPVDFLVDFSTEIVELLVLSQSNQLPGLEAPVGLPE